MVQHVLRKSSPESLNAQMEDFAAKIQPEVEGAVILYISGEVSWKLVVVVAMELLTEIYKSAFFYSVLFKR